MAVDADDHVRQSDRRPVLLAYSSSFGDGEQARFTAQQAGCRYGGVLSLSMFPPPVKQRVAATDEPNGWATAPPIAAWLVKARHRDGNEAALSLLLEGLDDRARGTNAPVVVNVDQPLIDLAAARLSAPSTTILCDPPLTEQVAAIAAGVALARSQEVNDVADSTAEREIHRLRRLSEDVERIARVLSSLTSERELAAVEPRADPVDTTAPEPIAPERQSALIRAMVRARRLRERFFDRDLFADPAWDMLLDLTANRLERKRVAVSSLCIAAAVPPTTALRHLKMLTDAGLFVRRPDQSDGRRVFIELSDAAAAGMTRYLSHTAQIFPAIA